MLRSMIAGPDVARRRAARGAFVLAALAVVAAAHGGCSSPAPTPDTFGADGGDAGGDGGACEVAKPRADAGASDAASCAAGGAGCAPGAVASFQPAWRPPTGLHQAKCADTDVATIVGCVFDPQADQATCASFVQAHQACNDCLFTPVTASAYGPLVVQANRLTTLNTGGCVALLEPCNLACGQAMTALQACTEAACAPSCPVTDGASAQALTACQETASACGCASYRDARSCFDAIAGRAGPAAVCEQPAAPFAQQAVTLGKLFCGGAS